MLSPTVTFPRALCTGEVTKEWEVWITWTAPECCVWMSAAVSETPVACVEVGKLAECVVILALGRLRQDLCFKAVRGYV